MIRRRNYQEVTYPELKKCLKWCQAYLNLRDWNIELCEGTHDIKDRSVGETIIEDGDEYCHIATVWIDLSWCRDTNANPYEVVCHEAIHVFVMGACRIDAAGDSDEPISYRFQDLLYREFCRANGVKVIKFESDN
jgi:hypothetical protein